MDTVSCVDAAGEITLTYTLGPALVQPVLSVEMQLTGDFGLSTDPDHPDHDGEYVSAGFIGDDVEGGDVSWKDADRREHLAMSFRIGRVSEARQAQVGGVVSVAGGGLWTITCRSSDLGM
ncbi:hypothetical protein [Devosia sp. CAU 1758]